MLEVDKSVFRPEALSQLVSGDELARPLEQDSEELERFTVHEPPLA
jgi:hypothetical protein